MLHEGLHGRITVSEIRREDEGTRTQMEGSQRVWKELRRTGNQGDTKVGQSLAYRSFCGFRRYSLVTIAVIIRQFNCMLLLRLSM